MKKVIAFIVILMMLFSASAELVIMGTCNAQSREGWALDENTWYSHLSAAETYGNVTVAFATTLSDGTILSDEEVFRYLDDFFCNDYSYEEIVSFDAEEYGIIEGIFAGSNQISEAVDLTIAIHDHMSKEADK